METDWTIEGPHGLHIVDGDRPVATFHDALDAARALACIHRVHGATRNTGNGQRPELDVSDFPLVVRQVVDEGHPFYGVDLDEVLRDWALAIQNAQHAAQERITAAERRADGYVHGARGAQAVARILQDAGKRKTLDAHAVRAALTNPEWRLQQPPA